MNTLPAVPEKIAAANKAGVDLTLRAAGIALESTERLLDLNLKTARAAVAEAGKAVRYMAGVRNPKELMTVKATAIQPTVDKSTAYARGLWEITSDTQAELAKLVEERVTQLNKTVVAGLDKVAKGGPVGSDVAVATVKSVIAAANSAYDSALKAVKKVADLTEANVAAASSVAAMAKKKAA
jgi:phasin family protein